jgi:hypothetical protein
MPNGVHDALFKATFSQVEHAAGELRHVLAPELVAHVDFATLALCPGSFVDEALAQRHTDLLFSVSFAERPAFLYVLFEHQSSPDPLMPFRLLRYMVRIWEFFLKDQADARRLPAILPVVLHHSETGWTAPTTFEAVLDVGDAVLPELAAYVPRFGFVLDDISHEPDTALRARAMSALGRLSLWCLRNARTPDELVDGMGRWVDLVQEVRRAPGGAAALAAIWRYIFLVAERLGPREVVTRLTATIEGEAQEDLVTAGEQLIEQGRLQGLQEGQRRMLLKQLRARFGALPEDATARVNRADAAELDLWSDRVLTAPSLAEVLGG